MQGLERYTKVVATSQAGIAVIIDDSYDIGFTIDGSWKKDPDTASPIKIYNASETTRSFIETDAVLVQVYAGRTFPPALIFQGEITPDTNNSRSDDFTTWVTEVFAEDTIESFRVSQVSMSFAAGTMLSVVVQSICVAAGVTPDVLFVDMAIPSPLSFLASGRKAIQTVCRRFNLRYQILKGRCSVRASDAPTNIINVPVLSAQTGLKGVPTVRKEDRRVKVSFRHMLESRLVAGGLCKLMTKSFSTRYKDLLGATYFIERVTHTSDADEQFDTECECRVYE